MKKKFSTVPYQIKIIKPWGYEVILTPPNWPVTGKILHLADGKRCSLQYHDAKKETLILFSGEAFIILENQKGKLEKIKMKKNQGYSIKLFQKHRLKGIKNCLILEVSTPEKGRTVRLADDYSRPTETPRSRKKRKAGQLYLG